MGDAAALNIQIVVGDPTMGPDFGGFGQKGNIASKTSKTTQICASLQKPVRKLHEDCQNAGKGFKIFSEAPGNQIMLQSCP